MSGLCKSKKAVRLEIRRTLVLSTLHMPPDLAVDIDEMADENRDQAYATFGIENVRYGYQMYVGDSDLYHPLVTFRMAAAIATANNHKCQYLVFDRDGPKVEGLPVFDWDDIHGARHDHVEGLKDLGGAWADYYWAPRSDWQSEAAVGYTQLGYWEWVAHRIEAEKPPTGNTGGSTVVAAA